MNTATAKTSTARVKADKARIDRLKEQLRSTPAEVDFERVRIMEEVYEDTAGYQQIIRRAKFMATLLERKKLYIDDNLFVGSMASTVNGIYTYPEWQVDWMKEENTVEKCKNPEDRKANEWALEYWDKRALKPRTLEIFEKKYGFDPRPSYDSGNVISFFDWPGGGGNLNYPRVYRDGLASMIKEVEEREAALEMRLPNADKFSFYEASLIVMQAIIRLAHRYAELAREMAAKETNPSASRNCSTSPRSANGCPSIRPATCEKPSSATSSVTSSRRSSRSVAAILRLTWARTSSRSIRPTRLPV